MRTPNYPPVGRRSIVHSHTRRETACGTDAGGGSAQWCGPIAGGGQSLLGGVVALCWRSTKWFDLWVFACVRQPNGIFCVTFVAHWLEERRVRARVRDRERECTKYRRTTQNGMGIKTIIRRLCGEREGEGAREREEHAISWHVYWVSAGLGDEKGCQSSRVPAIFCRILLDFGYKLV